MGRQFIDSHSLSGHFFGNLSRGQDQVSGRVLWIEMDKVFQHGQGLVFRSIGETRTWVRPPPAVAVRTFSIKWSARVCRAQHAKHWVQLMPP